jgi:hypothetical protein
MTQEEEEAAEATAAAAVSAAARQSYEDALSGSFGPLDRTLSTLGDERPDWAITLAAVRYFALTRPTRADLPSLEAVSSFCGAPAQVRGVAALAGAQLAKAALLAFDPDGVDDARALLARLTEELTPGEATDWLLIAEGWASITRSERPPLELDDVEARARRRGNADQVIESTVVRAFAAELTSDLAEALSLARRASRMARSESMPQQEFLAHLYLARIRRISGNAHLTMRIVSALATVVTPPWRTWLSWERLLSTGADEDIAVAGDLPRALSAVLEASRSGDPGAFAEGARTLTALAEGFAPCLVDVQHLLAAIDPRADLGAAPEDTAAFCRGATSTVPRGLHGVCDLDVSRGAPHVYVWSAPGHAPRRLLAPGAGLARVLAPEASEIVGDGRQLRTDSAIAELILAGDVGADEGLLFRRLYGFDFEPARHQSVRGVLYGRMRKRLGDGGELVREEGRIRIAHRGLLVSDPRCSPPAEQRILSILAERKRTGAKDLASELGIPLRTAQEALRRLRDDGVLRSEKAARGLHYILEDTTFSEPTRDGRY